MDYAVIRKQSLRIFIGFLGLTAIIAILSVLQGEFGELHLITIAVWAEIDEEGYYRLLSVVSIVVGLETLVVPILMKLRSGNGPVRETLPDH